MEAEQADTYTLPSLPTLAWRLALGLVVALAVVVGIGWLIREPVSAISLWFVDHFGLLGVFLVGCIVDAVPIGSQVPTLLLGYSGGLGFLPLVVAGSAGSAVASFLGYGVGRVIGRWGPLARLLGRWQLHRLFDRYGAWAIAIAALLPFPYSLATMTAGASKASLKVIVIGALFRVPKVLMHVGLIALGWEFSGL